MNYYICTSIPYVNGEPHIGHALEFVMADVLARAARQRGDTVIFCTGTDEHGSKVHQTAEKLKLTPKQLTDKMSKQFVGLLEALNISNDRFIRTTDKAHEDRAQLIWKALEHDIYKGKYTGWYDVKEEEFVPEGHADPERMKPGHPQAYQKLEEDNYFFKLSKYTAKIKSAIESGQYQIVPETRRNEILAVLAEGLDDIIAPQRKTGLGHPGTRRQNPSDVRVVRGAHELHHRARLPRTQGF